MQRRSSEAIQRRSNEAMQRRRNEAMQRRSYAAVQHGAALCSMAWWCSIMQHGVVVQNGVHAVVVQHDVAWSSMMLHTAAVEARRPPV